MVSRFLYTGWGPVVGLAGFFCVFITQIVVNAVRNDEQFYQTHDWPKLVGLACAAVLSFVIGHALNRRRERNAEERSRYTNEHSLFAIPVQYWWIVYLLLGVVIVLT